MKRRFSFVAALAFCFFASDPIAYAQQVRADTGGVAVGGNVSNSTVTIGIPPEQLAALVKQGTDLSEAQKKLIANLEGQLDLNQRQIRAALNILGETNVSPERLAARLVEIAERFKDLQASASTQPGDDPKVAALKADAQKAIDEGELAKADALLADAQTEERRDLDRRAVNAADTSARRGQIALTRLRYSEAAKHFAEAAVVFPPGTANEDKRIDYLKKEADALLRQGYEFGDNSALRSAIERYERLLELQPRARVPLDWAMSTGNQGVALRLIAERRGDIAMAQRALTQITEAFETSRDAHHVPNATYYEAQLPAARALVARLRKK
jgi:tetratricopeptide (TPR) repeat protein